MSSLDEMIGPTIVQVAGVEQTRRRSINFVGVTAVDDAVNDRTTLTMDEADTYLVAKTVFVDGTNGTASGTRGDASDPFATIAQGLAAMQSGDTLHVRPGSYSEQCTIPNLAVVHVVLEPGVTITSSEATTIVRSSSTALTTFTLDGGGATIANTHATGDVISLNGASVAAPGYGTGTGKIEIRNVRLSPNDTAQEALALTCLGTVFLEDVRGAGKVTAAQVGLLDARNVDQYRVSASAFTVGFNTGATLPTGYAGPGTLHCYSCKTGAVTLTGSLAATFDASCELASLTSTRSAGLLETGYFHIDGGLSINESGTATNSITGEVDGNVTATTAVNFDGLIRGDITASAGASVVRGTIVGTATEAGGTINKTATFGALDTRVTAVEGEPGLPRYYYSLGTLTTTSVTPVVVTGCSVTPAAGTYAVIVGADCQLATESTGTTYIHVYKDAASASYQSNFTQVDLFEYAGNCVVTVNGAEVISVKAYVNAVSTTFSTARCEMTLIEVTPP